ncbi:MAG: FAD-binding protein [Clostridiales bacterium]|nr:FAD-binding protein [Clostridiales bacterium]
MTSQTGYDQTSFRWPYELKYGKITHVNVDVLVVGGGLAGSCAAIAAARRGAKVAVVDKGAIKRSGCGGAGMDHWNNLLSNPDSPMTPEENLMKGNTKGRMGHRDYIAVKGTWEALLLLKEIGLPIEADLDDLKGAATIDRKTNLYKAYNYKDLIAVKLRGGQYLKPVLYQEMKKQGVRFFERVMVNRLYTEGNRSGAAVTGASGFSLETGEMFVFHAPAVILSCGYSCTIWTCNMELTGNSWRWDPNEVGEGLAMAWQAGAEIDGMFRNGKEGNPSPFAWPRFGVGNPHNTWFPCTIVDNNGKPIPWEDVDGNILTSIDQRNLPAASQEYCGSTISDVYKHAKTPGLIHDLPDRIRSGEFELPLWADLSGMPEDERRSIWGMMIGNEGKTRYTIFDLYTRMGFDPDKDMLMAPIMTPEGYNNGGWFHGDPNACASWRSESFGMQAQPAVDWKLMTSVPGLFAAGANSGLEGSSYACVSGLYAGNRAAEFAEGKTPGEIDHDTVLAEAAKNYAPIIRFQKGTDLDFVSWKELWAGSTRVMQQCCSEFKTDAILTQGLHWIGSIRNNEAQHTYARNPHELARVLECDTRLTISEMYLHGCKLKLNMERERLPEDTYLFCRLEDGKVLTRTDEPQYWLKAPCADSYLKNYELCRADEARKLCFRREEENHG